VSVIVPRQAELKDRFDRTIDYLRVSVTDHCNFRCVYCMPDDGFPSTPKEEVLSIEELSRIVGVAAAAGIRKVRLTGGEPLLLKGLAKLVGSISRLQTVTDLSCTTNGFLLTEKAQELKEAGLHRVNISLDTLKPERFQSIARRGDLQKVVDGIRTAMEVGFAPVKINCVLMKGINDDEAADFAAWTLKEELHVRFIELMPMRWNLDETPSEFDLFSAHGGKGLLQLRQCAGDMLNDAQMRRLYVPAAEAKASIESRFGPMEEAVVVTNGPARSFRIPGARGTVGFISQISSDLCERCNRIRLTHDGFLRPCLMSDGELDLRGPLRAGASDEELAELFRTVVHQKPERHYLAEGQRVTGRGMSQIGG